MANLDDVERYIIEQAKKPGLFEATNGLEQWVKDRFTELRMREEAKGQG